MTTLADSQLFLCFSNSCWELLLRCDNKLYRIAYYSEKCEWRLDGNILPADYEEVESFGQTYPYKRSIRGNKNRVSIFPYRFTGYKTQPDYPDYIPNYSDKLDKLCEECPNLVLDKIQLTKKKHSSKK